MNNTIIGHSNLVRTQYPNKIYNESDIVEAKYIEANASIDKDNLLIRALPPVLIKEEVYDLNTYNLQYDANLISEMSIQQKIDNITSLDALRICLPFANQVNINFHNALISSYRQRHRVKVNEKIESLDIQITDAYQSSGGAPSGFALLGFSGSGKTTTMNLLLGHYPQVITHTTDNSRMIQITYLKCECPTNQNIGALYASIGASVDRALGDNVSRRCEKRVSSARNNGMKVRVLCDILQKYNVGCIIIDEIQHLSNSNTKEDSFDNFLAITNETHIPFIIIGTPEAYSTIFDTYQKSRRIGPVIDATKYTQNKEYFNEVVKKIWHYQWYGAPLTLSDSLKEVLYEESKGLVSRLIELIKSIQIKYIKEDNPGIIDANYIHNVAVELSLPAYEILELSSINGNLGPINSSNEYPLTGINARNNTILIEKSEETLIRKVYTKVSNHFPQEIPYQEVRNLYLILRMNTTISSLTDEEIAVSIINNLEGKNNVANYS